MLELVVAGFSKQQLLSDLEYISALLFGFHLQNHLEL